MISAKIAQFLGNSLLFPKKCEFFAIFVHLVDPAYLPHMCRENSRKPCFSSIFVTFAQKNVSFLKKIAIFVQPHVASHMSTSPAYVPCFQHFTIEFVLKMGPNLKKIAIFCTFPNPHMSRICAMIWAENAQNPRI